MLCVQHGPSFANYEELRNLIAQSEPDFARGFTEHLVEYALGRSYGFTDQTLANEIIAAAKQNEFAVCEFIQALVLSKAFKTKKLGSGRDRLARYSHLHGPTPLL